MYGLVLEGGGGKGAFQIGVCKALAELGIEIAVVAGTSVGALNGAMVVQGDIDRAYELWYEMEPKSVIGLTDEELESFKVLKLNNAIKGLRHIILERGLDIGPLVKLVKSAVDEEKIRKSQVDFGIVTVDLTGRKAVEIFKEDIPEGKLTDYIIASASFPGFKPAVIDGNTYIDGGLYNALPINLVQVKGCTDVIAVRTYALGIKRRIDTSGLNLINITPPESLGSVLDFNSGRSRHNLKLGYYEALKVFHKLKGKRYYINPANDDDFFIEYLMRLSEVKIEKLGDLFGLEDLKGKRLLFEYLVPRVTDLLGLESSATYEDIAVGLLENIAGYYKVERFRIYNIRELYMVIEGKFQYIEDDFLREIPGFLRGKEIINKLVKERIISIIANILFSRDE